MAPHVLLVTYERGLANIYSDALRNDGFDVSWSCDEDRAISYLGQSRSRPDLIVLDHMPAMMNGVLTMIEMRRIYPEARFLLMGENRRVHRFAEEFGASEFVRRPHTIEKFLCIVEKFAPLGPQSGVRTGVAREVDSGREIRPSLPHPEVCEKYVPVHSRTRKLKGYRNIASAIVLLLAMIIPLCLGALVMIESRQSQAVIAVFIYSNHSMENTSFDLFVDGGLTFSGFTGDGHYARILINYSWASMNAANVEVAAISSENLNASQETISVVSGGLYYVEFNI